MSTKRSPRSPSPRVADKRQRARAEILEAAREVVRRDGVGGLTIDAIARVAGVSKPAVYYYFKNKDAVVRTLGVEDHEAECNAIVQAVEGAPEGPAVVGAFVRSLVHHYADDLEIFRVGYVWSQVVGLDPESVDENVNPGMGRVFGTLQERLLAEQRAGRLRAEVNTRRFAVVAWTSALGLLTTLSVCDSAQQRLMHDTDDLLDELVEALCFGVFEPSAR